MIQRFININGASIFLDNAYFNRGVFHVEPNTLGEQCEDCGQHIGDHGSLLRTTVGAFVVCDCGTRYQVLS